MKQLKLDFHARLSSLYSEREITSLVEWAVCVVMEWNRSRWFLSQEELLGDDQRRKVNDILYRLTQGEPMQYIAGLTLFRGLLFEVNSSVLIPRPETEELVEKVVSTYKDQRVSILDIGTGSGAIAIALSTQLPLADVEAWDISLEALLVAKSNNDRLQGRVLFRQVDVLNYDDCLENRSFDLIVSNPPYVLNSEKESIRANVLNFEPHLALFVPDDDPLLFYREIAKIGQKRLRSGGMIYFEINEQFAAETLKLLQSMGYCSCRVFADLSGRDRVVVAQYNPIKV